MSTRLRQLAIWLLAAVFAAATGGGEAWHLVPGNGHWIELPGGYAPCGFSSCCTTPVGQRDPAVATQPEPDSLTAADFCLICQLAGQVKLLSQVGGALRIVPAQDSFPGCAIRVPALPSVRGFDVRGPPSL